MFISKQLCSNGRLTRARTLFRGSGTEGPAWAPVWPCSLPVVLQFLLSLWAMDVEVPGTFSWTYMYMYVYDSNATVHEFFSISLQLGNFVEDYIAQVFVLV